jgi:ABC-type glycerol-3-phosphate transport system substrate-binding protein
MKKLFKTLCISAILFSFSGCTFFLPAEPEIATPKTVITVLHGQSTSDPGLEDMLSEKIASAFPDVILEWDSMDWGEYFSGEMRAKIASDTVPDIIIGKAQDVASYYSSGYLASFGEEFTQHIKPEGLHNVTIGGEVYGLPYNMLYQGVLYNRNIFYRFGLEVPRTTEDMEQLITRLNEVEITPFASHFQENWYSANILMQFAANQVFPVYPEWGDEFRAKLRSFSSSKEYIQCFEQVKTVFCNSWPDAMTVNQSKCNKRFANEEAAMFVTGTWSIQTLHSIRPDMKIGFFPYPNQRGDAKLIYEPNITFMRNAHSENTELADKIILALIEDKELAASVAAFTQTESLIKDVEVDSLTMIRDDVDDYMQNSKAIDVTIGNNQLIWYFQDICAQQMAPWLNDKTSLESMLGFADANRSMSK